MNKKTKICVNKENISHSIGRQKCMEHYQYYENKPEGKFPCTIYWEKPMRNIFYIWQSLNNFYKGLEKGINQ